MTPFLKQVARYYLTVNDLEDYCFVFPNRRSGQFFSHYLQQELVAADVNKGVHIPHLMPCVTSINELVAQLTGTVAATDIQMIFALYDAYCQAMGDDAQEFDKFIYWAQLIISDFNDIDRSMVDAGEIYRNLSDLHGLSSNYITDEVIAKVKQIFGESLFTAFFDTSAEADLWQERAKAAHEPNGDEKVKREFMSLWNALETIYHLFHEILDKKDVVSPGRQLRMAAQGNHKKRLFYTRLVFVGFGVLSAAEVLLFKHFDNEAIADFWWDNAGLQLSSHDPGALLINGYCETFKAKPIEPLTQEEQHIRVVAVPSNVGQAKLAFDEVARMKQGDGSFGIETAVVLPDENLLVPLLHSVHGVSKLNVTLGYPLRSSGIVSLMHIVARMHHQASKEKGKLTYYREDVYDILSHPLIKSSFTSEALTMMNRLAETNRFRIPSSEFETLSFHDLFTPAIDSEENSDTREQTEGYLNNLLSFCDLLMERMQSSNQPYDDDETDAPSIDELVMPLQQAFLVEYIDSLNQLKRALDEEQRPLQRGTVFYLVDRLTAATMVSFTGEPLQGLQVMGLFETRGLDFENLVILSMNERVFPRRRSMNSFIPNYIRRAHGMSTIEQQEAIVAFNFYRLLNRSRNVTLIYDSSRQKLGSSEPSRYITQLEKIYGRQLEYVNMDTVNTTSAPISIEVPNQGYDVLRENYLKHHTYARDWFLSASAINMYINCPLSFYIHYVQGLNNDNESSDFMDYGTFGTIVHDTLGECYDCEQSRACGGVISKEYIESFKKNRLDKVVRYNIKKSFLHVPEKDLPTHDEPIEGEAYMLIDTIKSYVNFVLDYDLELIDKTGGPFTIVECEQSHPLENKRIGEATFNFTYKPDRIDRLHDGMLRIVDYKTGSDNTAFATMDDLFDGNKSSRCKAILQLFLYSYAYLLENPEEHQVMPVIYKLASMQDSGVTYKGENGSGQYIFSMDDPVALDFMNKMGGVIKSLYEQSFTQAAEGAKSCNYCRFIDFCRRTPTKTQY